MSTLERAIAIAAQAHAGHIDKAGERYILHPLRVMLSMDIPISFISTEPSVFFASDRT